MSPPFVEPVFLINYAQYSEPVNDYRPVVNASATAVIFERQNLEVEDPPIVLYEYSLITGAPPVSFLQGTPALAAILSTRPDWSWVSGEVAFSNDQGVWIVGADGANPVLLEKTERMIYPAWFPSAEQLAVMNQQEKFSPLQPLPNTSTIATDGTVIAAALAGAGLWAGMPSVNPKYPNLIVFAGQNVQKGGSYNQDTNYIWLVDTLQNPVVPVPLEKGAPSEGPFDKNWQGRAPWWSPDGNWVVFESNRPPTPSSDNNNGLYSIFVYQHQGSKSAARVTAPQWNMNHAKWFPWGSDPSGTKTLVVASYQPGRVAPGAPAWPYGIASLDVSAFVS